MRVAHVHGASRIVAGPPPMPDSVNVAAIPEPLQSYSWKYNSANQGVPAGVSDSQHAGGLVTCSHKLAGGIFSFPPPG